MYMDICLSCQRAAGNSRSFVQESTTLSVTCTTFFQSYEACLPTPVIVLIALLQAVQLVRQMNFQQVALGLLYHISQDDRHKSMFIYTDAVTVMLDLLMHVDDLTTTPELIALAVNLTQNDRIAEVGSLGGVFAPSGGSCKKHCQFENV